MNKRKRNEQTKYQAEKEKAFKGWAYYTDMKRNDVLGLVWEEEEKEEEKIQDYIELPPRSYITPDLYKEGVILKKKRPTRALARRRKFCRKFCSHPMVKVYTITIRKKKNNLT